jgi:hypothetical protein
MMDETVTALPHAGMLLETSFTQLNFDSSYALDAAVVESHVAHGMGTGVQSLQAADISGYNENPTSMGSCSGAWCYFFDQHDQKAATAERAPFYHLQLFACSNPTSTPCTPGDPLGKTGTAVNLISFARQRMNAPINILEFWPQDIALWADPNYCVKGTPDDGTCHAGSMSNAHYEYLAYRDAYAAAFRDFRK